MKGKAFHINTGLMPSLNIIVAVDELGGFGKDGKIPWHYPEDLKHFQQVTKDCACIMGRKTYEDMYSMVVARKSKGKEFKTPVRIKNILPGRDNYVVTKQEKLEGVTTVNNIRKATILTKKDKIFILGGERIFIEALPFVNKVYLTLVKGDFNCDRFFPVDYLTKHFKITGGEQGGHSFLFVNYERIK